LSSRHRSPNALVLEFRRGAVPRDIRLMAAQGLLPLELESVLELWLLLARDPDEDVRFAAEASLAHFPEDARRAIVTRRDVSPEVLAWALGSPSTLDETVETVHATAMPRVDSAKPEEPDQTIAVLDQSQRSLSSEANALRHFLTEEEKRQKKKVSLVLRLYGLSTGEKIVTALKGTKDERAILVRDPNPLVALAVLASPRLTETEIESFASMKDAPIEVLRHIGNHRDWTKRYKVLSGLVHNPRTPRGIALSLVPRLNPRDLKTGGTLGGAASEEKEFLTRLDELLVTVNRLFAATAARLTSVQREQIEIAIERARAELVEGRLDELQACLRLLLSARDQLE
jgi:hypothetical protein